MSKKGLAIFRLLILCFGLLLIGAGYKFSPVKEGLENWRINYLWISITIAYLAIFFPILSPIPVKDSSDSFIMSGIIFTIADIILVTVSLTLGILSYKGIFSFILWPLLIQGAVFFFFLISLLICITTTSHVKSVSQTEFNKKALLSEIKQFSEQLSILSNSLGETNNELKEKMIFI